MPPLSVFVASQTDLAILADQFSSRTQKYGRVVDQVPDMFVKAGHDVDAVLLGHLAGDRPRSQNTIDGIVSFQPLIVGPRFVIPDTGIMLTRVVAAGQAGYAVCATCHGAGGEYQCIMARQQFVARHIMTNRYAATDLHAQRGDLLELAVDDARWAKELRALIPRLAFRLARADADLGIRKFRIIDDNRAFRLINGVEPDGLSGQFISRSGGIDIL